MSSLRGWEETVHAKHSQEKRSADGRSSVFQQSSSIFQCDSYTCKARQLLKLYGGLCDPFLEVILVGCVPIKLSIRNLDCTTGLHPSIFRLCLFSYELLVVGGGLFNRGIHRFIVLLLWLNMKSHYQKNLTASMTTHYALK